MSRPPDHKVFGRLTGWRKRYYDIVTAPGGLGMRAASKKAGLSHGYVSGVLRGRTPSVDNFTALADAVGVAPGWLLMEDDALRIKIPVVGVASDKEAWRAVDGKAGVVEFDLGEGFDVIGIEVRGNSMAPVYRDQDYLVCQRRAGSFGHNLIGADCVVRTADGEQYLKILDKGRRPNTFNLRSYTSGVRDIENVLLEWVAPVVWVKRGGR